MSLLSLLAFAGAMFLLALTPGPGVFVTVASSLAHGVRYAAFVIAGIVVGDLLFLLFAVFGLAAIAVHLHGAFLIVKYAAALYLVFLGIKLWREKPGALQAGGLPAGRSGFLTGLFVTLGNPKVILFYLGFLPLFVDLAALSYLDLLIIVSVVAAVLGSTMFAYALAAAGTRKRFGNERAQRLLNRTAGGAMMAAGAALAVKT